MTEATTDSPDAGVAGSTDGAAGPPARTPLSSSIKTYYGLPTFVAAAMTIPILIHMSKFYADVVLLPLGYIGLAIAIARSFDAITDPVMGWISDRTRSKWGRRKPWIALGAPLCAIFLYLQFSPPRGMDQSAAAIWFAGTFTFYFLFHTMYEVPYAGLGAELTPDYHERSALFGRRAIFIALGTIIGALAPELFRGFFGTDRAVFNAMGAIYAVGLVLLFGLLVLKVPERRDFVGRASNPLVPGVRRSLRNRPFRIFLVATIVYAVPILMPALMLPFFVQYVLQVGTTWLAVYLFIYFVSGIVCVPIWVSLSTRYGKLPVWIACNLIGVTGGGLFFLAGPGDTTYVALVQLYVGTQSAAFYFLPPSMLADVIDYDELRTGQRRESQYMSFIALIPKFAAIPGGSIPLAVLGSVGYVPNEVQSESVQTTIRLMYSLVPAVFNLAALFIIMRYPLTEQVHYEIQKGVFAHSKGQPAKDPITGDEVAPPGSTNVDDDTGWFLDHFSKSELAYLRDGGKASTVAMRAWVSTVASAAVCVGAVVTAVSSVEGLDSKPGPLTVVTVVTAGLALTLTLFHLVRARASAALTESPPEPAVVGSHLEASL